MGIIIRDYRPEDEPAWIRCWGQVVVTSHAWNSPPYEVRPRYSRPSVELVVVDQERPTLVVGFINVEIERSPGELGLLEDSPCGFVWELGLLPEYRQRGLGRRLVREAASQLAGLGVRRMEFWSMDENAQGFYEGMGMKEMNRHYRFWIDGGRVTLGSGLGGARCSHAYATCSVEDWAAIEASGAVLRAPPFEPRLCRGFDYRF